MTEQSILQAAKAVFLRKGLDAATMQDIAAEAHISRTLLHYYHRNKDTLFRAILVDAVGEFVPKVAALLEMDIPLMAKIECLVDAYIDVLAEDPLLPHFMILEIRRDPQVLVQLFRDKGGEFCDLSHIKKQFATELGVKGDTERVLAHLFTSLYGLIMFPFLVKPALDEVFFDNNLEATRSFMLERKSYVLAMMKTLLETIAGTAAPARARKPAAPRGKSTLAAA